jgi:hypothetical protein
MNIANTDACRKTSLGNRIIYDIDKASIAKPSDELSRLASIDIRAHAINKISDTIWMNIIDGIRNTIRLNLMQL